MLTIDDHVSLEVRDDLVGRSPGRITLVDPQNSFTRSGHDFALPNLTTAAQQPYVKCTFAPSAGLVRCNANGRLNVRHG